MRSFCIKNKGGDVLWEGEARTFLDALERAMEDDAVRYTCVSHIDFSGHDLSEIPAIPGIDRAILRALEAGGRLNMGRFHGDDADEDEPEPTREQERCGTTHCRAGWAIHLAGEAGYALEDRFDDAEIAGKLIYAASRPGRPIPDFYETDYMAMADLRACAAG